MDQMLDELFKKGDSLGSLLEQVDWFNKVHHQLSQSPEFRPAAARIKEAADLLSGLKDAPEDEQGKAEPVVADLLAQAQGLALFGYLTSLKKLRDAIAAEGERLKPDSPNRKRCDELKKAYDQTLSILGAAYNGIREGNFDAADKVPEQLEQVRVAAEQWSNKPRAPAP